MAGLGQNPAPIAMPNPQQDLRSALPQLDALNGSAGTDLLAKLGGSLSPGTTAAIQNAAATYGARNGMPGANGTLGTLPSNMNLQSLGLNAEGLSQQGLEDYSRFLPTVSGTQTVAPGLQTEINTQNAFDAAAPNPTTVANHAQDLFNQYLQMLSGPAGGTGQRTQLLGPRVAGQGNPTVRSANGIVPPELSGYGSPGYGPPVSASGPAGQTSIGGVAVKDGSTPYSFDNWLQDTFGGAGGSGIGAGNYSGGDAMSGLDG